MAVFKCKMCGGSLNVENESVAVCEYCGTKQTLPRLTDERRAGMFDRANHFRRNGEYDKAMGVYEQILFEDNTDAESYWSLVLCRFGIEYVKDPATGKRIPTINRVQYTSVYDDDNYKQAINFADIHQKVIYEEEAAVINNIQKGILDISKREQPFDVFICYKESDSMGRRTLDSVLATDIYEKLTKEGLKVFFARITLEDKLGSAYEPYIFAALNSSKVMIALGTSAENFNAVWVRNEWSRYLALIKNGEDKTLIPAYRDMSPYDLPDEFSHLQAQDMGRIGFMQDLVRGVKKIVYPEGIQNENTVTPSVPTSNAEALLKRAFLSLEDGDFKKADEFLEQVLNNEPENAEAYLGKLMAEMRVKKKNDLKNSKTSLESNANYQKVIRFGDEKLISELKGYAEEVNARIEENKQKQVILNQQRQQEILNMQKNSSSFPLKGILIAVFGIVAVVAVVIIGTVVLGLPVFKTKNTANEMITRVEEVTTPVEVLSQNLSENNNSSTESNINVGDYITFGTYEQDNNTANGKEKIEWLVLEVKDGKALVISKYALDCKPYNTSSTDVTWETCTLRKWLNNDFLGAAFSADEKAMIPTVTVSADKNPDYSTNPGNATQDQVFLLSISEANKYFNSDSARQCEATDYAVANGAYVNSGNSNCWWWLRSPGGAQFLAALVDLGGGVGESGNYVDGSSTAVRPALWIDLNS